MQGGFQNYLHLMYGLPNGWFAPVVDTDKADILKRRKKRQEQQLEEEYALMLLRQRAQEDVVIPTNVNPQKLKAALQRRVGDVKDEARARRIRTIITILALEDS